MGYKKEKSITTLFRKSQFISKVKSQIMSGKVYLR